MKSERIAIVGSINFSNPDLVREYVQALPKGVTIVSGGAKGVDTWAEEAALESGLDTLIFQADWEGLGRRAGPIRNEQIIAHADRVVAFWNATSRGTLNSLINALNAGLPISIIGPEAENIPLIEAMNKAEESGAFQSWLAGQRRAGKPAPETLKEMFSKTRRKRNTSAPIEELATRCREEFCIPVEEEYGYREWIWFPPVAVMEIEKFWESQISFTYSPDDCLCGEWFNCAEDEDWNNFNKLYSQRWDKPGTYAIFFDGDISAALFTPDGRAIFHKTMDRCDDERMFLESSAKNRLQSIGH